MVGRVVYARVICLPTYPGCIYHPVHPPTYPPWVYHGAHCTVRLHSMYAGLRYCVRQDSLGSNLGYTMGMRRIVLSFSLRCAEGYTSAHRTLCSP